MCYGVFIVGVACAAHVVRFLAGVIGGESGMRNGMNLGIPE